jgi:DNA-binding IclR family transcriptional regulator
MKLPRTTAGHPVAAISVSGPAYRILAEKKKIGQAVQAACRSISQSLDFNTSTPKRN